MIDNKPKRIIHTVSAMNYGGAESMLMNIYRNIDRSKVQFDFIVHNDDEGDFDKEISDLGGRIFRCKSLGSLGIYRYIRQLTKIMKNNGPYIASHSHTDFQSGVVSIAAKRAKINNRICHSHSTNWHIKDNMINRIKLFIFKILIRLYGNNYCACGQLASEYLFLKSINRDKVLLINNSIDLNKYNADIDIDELKKELKIKQGYKIIGHIGRFFEVKNHEFIIEIANNIKLIDDKFIIILVGDGPLKKKIEEDIRNFNLEKNFILLGNRSDINKLMKLFDIFILPSLYEGVPLVLVEAQASGLPCIISENISKEVDLGLDLIRYCSIDMGSSEWINKINEYSGRKENNISKIKDIIINRGYDIQNNIDKIMKIYKI